MVDGSDENIVNNKVTFRPRAPIKLKSLDTDKIQEFVHEMKTYFSYFPSGEIAIYEFISAELGEKLIEEAPDTFKRSIIFCMLDQT